MNFMRSPVQTLLYALLTCLALILTQCSSKGSDEYVKEGIDYSKQGQYDKAFDAFLTATRVDPKNPAAFYGLGGIYNYRNQHKQAVEAFKATIRLDPTHFNARYSLGFTYEKLGKKELAREEYARHHNLKKRFENLVQKRQENH
jgi:tetratricopeptide (TPR) repeat protein